MRVDYVPSNLGRSNEPNASQAAEEVPEVERLFAIGAKYGVAKRKEAKR